MERLHSLCSKFGDMTKLGAIKEFSFWIDLLYGALHF